MFPYLSEDVAVHQVLATKLPRAWEVIIMLVHVIVAKCLWLQRRTPHDVPIWAISLLEACPTERIHYAVIRMDAL